MIDSLARHMAALREARRLIGMVLANNGAFTALKAAQAARDEAAIATCEASLATDKAYQAYCQLDGALAQIAPQAAPSEESGRWLDKITLLDEQIRPPVGEAPAQEGSSTVTEFLAAYVDDEVDDPESLGSRLNRVLELTSMAQVPSPSNFATQRDEAQVSIICRDAPQAFAGPSRSPNHGHPELIRLFR